MAKEETKNKKTKQNKSDDKKTKTTKATKKTKTIKPKKENIKVEAKVEKDKKSEPRKEEESSYIRTLLAAILIIIIFLGGYLTVQYNKHKDNNNTPGYTMTDDERTFKEEYETLNNTTRANGTQNKKISIMEDNNIVYITLDEAVDILDSGSGIIYFGYAADPYSRIAVPTLLEAMDVNSLDKIYYVNIRPNDKEENDLRDIYTLNEKNKAKKTKEASSNAYYEVITSLANYLQEYVLYTSKGKKIDTGVKRLNTPTVVAVLEGEIVDFHEGTVEKHELAEDQSLRDLTEEEHEKLLDTYSKLISHYLNNDCEEGEEKGC